MQAGAQSQKLGVTRVDSKDLACGADIDVEILRDVGAEVTIKGSLARELFYGVLTRRLLRVSDEIVWCVDELLLVSEKHVFFFERVVGHRCVDRLSLTLR